MTKSGLAGYHGSCLVFYRKPFVETWSYKNLFTPDEEVGQGTAKWDMKNWAPASATRLMGEKPAALKTKPSALMQRRSPLHGGSFIGYAKDKL